MNEKKKGKILEEGIIMKELLSIIIPPREMFIAIVVEDIICKIKYS